jgi:nitrogen fixation NifU-like protein
VTDPNSDLDALYRELILDHGKRPRHAALPARVDRQAERDNPLCGDRVTVGIALDGETIVHIGFQAEGCLICIAAASLMCEAVTGSSCEGARDLCGRYLGLVSARAARWPEELGVLSAFAAVARFPTREACASLAWQALQDAIAGGSGR